MHNWMNLPLPFCFTLMPVIFRHLGPISAPVVYVCMMSLSAATPRKWLPAIVFRASTVCFGQRYPEVIWNGNTARASKNMDSTKIRLVVKIRGQVRDRQLSHED